MRELQEKLKCNATRHSIHSIRNEREKYGFAGDCEWKVQGNGMPVWVGGQKKAILSVVGGFVAEWSLMVINCSEVGFVSFSVILITLPDLSGQPDDKLL